MICKPSETKQDIPWKMEPTAITGVFAGYELALGCTWNGIYMVWFLPDLPTWTYQQRVRHCQDGIVVLTIPKCLNSLRKVWVSHLSRSTTAPISCSKVSGGTFRRRLLACPSPTTRTILRFELCLLVTGGRNLGKHWMRIHTLPRNTAYITQLDDG